MLVRNPLPSHESVCNPNYDVLIEGQSKEFSGVNGGMWSKGHRGAAFRSLPYPGSGLRNLKEVKLRIKTFISVFLVYLPFIYLC